MTVRALLPLFTPLVNTWALWQRRRVLRRGRPLSKRQRRIAAAVGVVEPDRIRLQLVPRVPIPGGAWVDALARRIGLAGSDVDGLTLGHAIYIREAALSDDLLAHECRHVQQCEAAGSMRRFLAAYLRQVARHGYRHAPYEVDARTAAKRCVAQLHQRAS
jgi:hypothetical protein